ncbi:PTS sugar transporter subunit IIA, partial [Oharaeibacter diazotrophicus]
MNAASRPLLAPALVRLGARPASKDEAIRLAAGLLADAGYVDPAYAGSMLRREAVAETHLGHGVAIPHGMVEDRALVRHNGIAVVQVPEGVTWNAGQTVRLVFAIAAQSDAHIAILRKLTRLLQDEAKLADLAGTGDPLAIVAALDADAAAAFAAADAAPPADLPAAAEWVVDYPSGLHARPAARWVEAAR